MKKLVTRIAFAALLVLACAPSAHFASSNSFGGGSTPTCIPGLPCDVK